MSLSIVILPSSPWDILLSHFIAYYVEAPVKEWNKDEQDDQPDPVVVVEQVLQGPVEIEDE
jgi:hypothetical protein